MNGVCCTCSKCPDEPADAAVTADKDEYSDNGLAADLFRDVAARPDKDEGPARALTQCLSCVCPSRLWALACDVDVGRCSRGVALRLSRFKWVRGALDWGVDIVQLPQRLSDCSMSRRWTCAPLSDVVSDRFVRAASHNSLCVQLQTVVLSMILVVSRPAHIITIFVIGHLKCPQSQRALFNCD